MCLYVQSWIEICKVFTLFGVPLVVWPRSIDRVALSILPPRPPSFSQPPSSYISDQCKVMHSCFCCLQLQLHLTHIYRCLFSVVLNGLQASSFFCSPFRPSSNDIVLQPYVIFSRTFSTVNLEVFTFDKVQMITLFQNHCFIIIVIAIYNITMLHSCTFMHACIQPKCSNTHC